jgi:hypothetical protein
MEQDTLPAVSFHGSQCYTILLIEYVQYLPLSSNKQ